MLGGLIILVSALFASEFLTLLIRSGVSSDTVVVFLLGMLGLLVFSTVNFFSAGLFYERKVHLLPIAYYGVVLIKFAVGILLIPLFGLVGAAISALFSYCALPYVIRAMSKKYFSFRVEWKRLFVFSVISAPALLYGLLFSTLQSVSFVIRLVWLFVSVWLIYWACFSAGERKSMKALSGSIFR